MSSAHAIFGATRVMVLGQGVASAVDAQGVFGIPLVNIVLRAYCLIAVSPKLTAFIRVRSCALVIITKDHRGIDPVDILRRAGVSVTVALFNAARVEISLHAILIIAKELVGIVPMLEADGARVAVARALWCTTLEPVVISAFPGLARNICRTCFDDKASWAFIAITPSNDIAAFVPVQVAATKAIFAIDVC